MGKFFAQQFINKEWIVSGTCTSNANKLKLEEMGFNVHKFNANEPEVEVLDDLSRHTHFLVSIPPLEGIGVRVNNFENLYSKRCFINKVVVIYICL